MYKIIFLLSAILLQACNAQQKKVDFKGKDPLYQQKLDAFNKQQHRLEIDECEIHYNGKSFFIGSSIEEIIEVLGADFTKSIGKFSGKKSYVWERVGIKARLIEKSKKTEYISFNLIKTPQKIIFCGVFIDKNTLMQDFVIKSNYSFNDFLIGNHSYELILEECKNPQKIYISSDVPWLYSGSGHLQVKDKIDYTKTKKIETIEFSFSKKNK